MWKKCWHSLSKCFAFIHKLKNCLTKQIVGFCLFFWLWFVSFCDFKQIFVVRVGNNFIRRIYICAFIISTWKLGYKQWSNNFSILKVVYKNVSYRSDDKFAFSISVVYRLLNVFKQKIKFHKSVTKVVLWDSRYYYWIEWAIEAQNHLCVTISIYSRLQRIYLHQNIFLPPKRKQK